MKCPISILAKECLRTLKRQENEKKLLIFYSPYYLRSVSVVAGTLKEYTYYGDVSTIGNELKKLIPDSYVTVETSEGTIKITMDSNKKITYTNLKTGEALTSDKVDELTKLKNQKLKKYTALSDEIGYFDISSQDLYSFLTQDAAQFFNCIFIFDFDNFKINAYRPEQLGKNTNINISFGILKRQMKSL